jgi:hypothetical protein
MADRRDASGDAEHNEREHEHYELPREKRLDDAGVHRHRLDVDVGDDVGGCEKPGDDLRAR